MRSPGAIAILIAALLLGLAGCYGCSVSNTLVGAEEDVNRAWSDVENQYQRRADLVPQLVEAAEAAADLERDLIVAVTRSRAEVLSLGPGNPRSETDLSRFGTAQQRFSEDLSRLTSAAGRHAELQSVEAYRDLLVQIEGTENRIAVARRKYNESVSGYNTLVRTFPRSLYAGMLGHGPIAGFRVDSSSNPAGG